MWIRLKKEVDGGTVCFVLPDTNKKLAFNDGDKLNCLLSDGRELGLEVVHVDVPYENIDGDGVVNWLERRAPQAKDKSGNLYELDLVEVDSNEIQKYVSN